MSGGVTGRGACADSGKQIARGGERFEFICLNDGGEDALDLIEAFASRLGSFGLPAFVQPVLRFSFVAENVGVGKDQFSVTD